MNEAVRVPAMIYKPDETAKRMAKRIRLSSEVFGQVYNRVRGDLISAEQWEVIAAKIGSQNHAAGMEELRQKQFAEANLQALNNEFGMQLAEEVGEAQAIQTGDRAQLSQLIKEAGDIGGLMHGITDRARGLMDDSVIDALHEARRAIGVLRNGESGPVLGTGFLVGRDLVLTSAHVVMHQPNAATGDPSYQLLSNIFVEFPNADARRKGMRRQTALAKNALEAFAPPHGKPPNLDPTMGPAALKNLDFALLRLARRFDDIVPNCDHRSAQARGRAHLLRDRLSGWHGLQIRR